MTHHTVTMRAVAARIAAAHDAFAHHLDRLTGARVRRVAFAAAVGAAAATVPLATPRSARAQTAAYNWNGGGGNANWSTGGNWAGGTAPSFGGSSSTALVFAGTTGLTANNDLGNAGNPFNLANLTFALGSGAFNLTGGPLAFSGARNVLRNESASAITVGNDLLLSSLLNLSGSGTTTLSGTIQNNGSSTGSLLKTGTGKVILTGNNTFTGGLTVRGGTVQGSSLASFGTGSLTVGTGATLAAAGYALDQSTINRLSSSAGVLALGVSSANSLDFTNYGQVRLGVLGGTTVTYSGALSMASGGTTNQYLLGGGGGGTLILNQTNQLTGSKILDIDGAGTTTGTIRLDAANNYSGGTYLRSGTLLLNAAGATGSGSTYLLSGTSLVSSVTGGAGVSSGTVYLAPGSTYTTTYALDQATLNTLNRTSGGYLLLGTASSNALNLTQGNTFNGLSNLRIGAASGTSAYANTSYTGTITPAQTSLTGATTHRFGGPYVGFGGQLNLSANAVTGSAGIDVATPDVALSSPYSLGNYVILFGANSYTGATAVGNGGNFSASATNAISASSLITVGGNSLFLVQATNAVSSGARIQVGASGIIYLNSTNGLTSAAGTPATVGLLTGANLDLTSSGALTQTSLNYVTADSAGVVNLDTTGTPALNLGSATASLNHPTLRISTGSPYDGSLTTSFGGTLTAARINPANTALRPYLLGGGGGNLFLTATNALTGTTGLEMGAGGSLSAAGIVYLSNSNSLSGPITVNAGTLSLTAANALNSGASGSFTVAVNPGGILRTSNTAAFGGSGQSITINPGGVLVADYAADQTLLNRVAGGSAGVFALGVNSSNALDFSGASVYLGALHLGAAPGVTATYSGTLTPNANGYQLGGGGGTLVLNQTNQLAPNNTLTVGGSPGFYGPQSGGVVSLTAANTFNGQVVINPGAELALNAAGALYGPGSNPYNTFGINAGGVADLNVAGAIGDANSSRTNTLYVNSGGILNLNAANTLRTGYQSGGFYSTNLVNVSLNSLVRVAPAAAQDGETLARLAGPAVQPFSSTVALTGDTTASSGLSLNSLRLGAAANTSVTMYGGISTGNSQTALGGGGAGGTLTLASQGALPFNVPLNVGNGMGNGFAVTNTVILGADNALSNAVTVTDGSLILDAPNALNWKGTQTLTATVQSGATLRLNYSNAFSPSTTSTPSIALPSGATLVTGYNDSGSILRLLTANAAGVLALATDSSGAYFDFLGSTSFSNFTARPNLRLGASGNVSLLNGTIAPSANIYRLGGGGGTLTLLTNILNSSLAALDVSGGGTSSGTVAVNTPQSYFGATTVSGGETLALNTTLAIRNTSSVTVGSGGTLTLNAPGALTNSSSVNPVTTTVQAGGTLRVNVPAAIPFNSNNPPQVALQYGGTLLLGTGMDQSVVAALTSDSAGAFALGSDSGAPFNYSTGTTFEGIAYNVHPFLRLGAAGDVRYDGTLQSSATSGLYRLGGGGGTLILPMNNQLPSVTNAYGATGIEVTGSGGVNGGTPGTVIISGQNTLASGAIPSIGAGGTLILNVPGALSNTATARIGSGGNLVYNASNAGPSLVSLTMGGLFTSGYPMDSSFIALTTVGSVGTVALGADSYGGTGQLLDFSTRPGLRLGAWGGGTGGSTGLAGTYTSTGFFFGVSSAGSTWNRLGGGGGTLLLSSPFSLYSAGGLDINAGPEGGTVLLTAQQQDNGVVQVNGGNLELAIGGALANNTSVSSTHSVYLNSGGTLKLDTYGSLGTNTNARVFVNPGGTLSVTAYGANLTQSSGFNSLFVGYGANLLVSNYAATAPGFLGSVFSTGVLAFADSEYASFDLSSSPSKSLRIGAAPSTNVVLGGSVTPAFFDSVPVLRLGGGGGTLNFTSSISSSIPSLDIDSSAGAAGTVNFSAPVYVGPVSVRNNTVNLVNGSSSNGSLPLSSQVSVSQYGTLTVAGGFDLSGSGLALRVGQYGTLLLNSPNAVTPGNSSFGTGTLQIDPAGLVQINATNALSSGVSISLNGGNNSPATLASASFNQTILNKITPSSSGLLLLTGDFSGNNSNIFDLGTSGGGTADHPGLKIGTASGQNVSYSGNLFASNSAGYRFSGDGALTIVNSLLSSAPLDFDGGPRGTGLLTLSGSNSLGAITVRGGTLNLVNSGAAGTAPAITVSGNGILRSNNGLSGSGAAITLLGGNATAALGDTTTNGPQSYLSRLSTSSLGTFALIPVNSSVTSGVLNFTGYSGLSFGAVDAVSFSGSLLPTADGVYRLGGGGGTLTLSGFQTLSTAGTSLMVSGPGTVQLANGQTYTGATTIGGGANFVLGSGGSLATNTILVGAGGTFTLANFVIFNALTAAPGIFVSGGGQVIDRAGMGVEGASVISVGNGGIVAGAVPITSGSGSGSGGGIVPSLVSSLSSSSTGVLALGANSLNNVTLANLPGMRLGALPGGSGGPGGGSSGWIFGGTLTPNGTTYNLGGGGGTLILARANTLSGSTAVNVGANGTAGGTVVLGAVNTYTGTTTVGTGSGAGGGPVTLQAAVSSAIQSGAAITVNSGGTVALTAPGAVSNSAATVTVNSGGILRYEAADGLANTSSTAVTINSGGIARYGFPFEQTYLNQISSGSSGVVALGASTANALSFSTANSGNADRSNLRLGAAPGVLATVGGNLYAGSSNVYHLGGGGGTLLLGGQILVSSGASIDISDGGTGTGGTVVALRSNPATGAVTVGGNMTASAQNLAGTPAFGSGTIAVNAAGTLTGNGTVAGIQLNSGGTVAPGLIGTIGTLTASSLVWGTANGTQGTLLYDLGLPGVSDRLALSGGFTNGFVPSSSGQFGFAFSDGGGLQTGSTYTLVTWGTGSGTNFQVSDFSAKATGNLSDIQGQFALDTTNGNLKFTVSGFTSADTPEPSTLPLVLGSLSVLAGVRCRRRHRTRRVLGRM